MIAAVMWLWLVLIAAATGSFLACAAIRLPQGKGLGGRSACPHCGRTLDVIELIPVLSWVWQRGRCRSCTARLSPLYPVVEASAVIIAVLCARWTEGVAFVALLILGWAGLFVVSTTSVILCHRIPLLHRSGLARRPTITEAAAESPSEEPPAH